jgi:outer membrane lipoprotein-sorting protein
MSKRVLKTLLMAIAVAAFASLAAQAADGKGGIEGKVAKVDAAKGSVTITAAGGEQTFTVTATTQIVGPRGGLVRRRLHDPRFHAGLPITVVANGTTATELLLGVDRKAAKTTGAKDAKSQTSGFRGDNTGKADGKSDEEADDDNDFPGKIKSVDADKNLIVVTLLNGKDRSFMVGSEAKLTIGRRVSQKGLSDPALRPGARLTIVTDEGGRKVKEVKVNSALGGGRMRSIGGAPKAAP